MPSLQPRTESPLRRVWFACLAAALTPCHGQFLSTAEAPTGALLGEVRNSSGTAQMGAAIFLYDRHENLIRRAISAEDGRFAFLGLTPDIYHVRVTLASFFPALRRNIVVLAGSENLLRVSLAAVFSSVEFVPGAPGRATLMSEEWKWVLRSAQTTRPVLRLLPPEPPKPRESAALFSDMTGVVRVSGGDSNLLNGALQQDMGTAFAVETSTGAGGKVRLAGSLGYGAASGLPSTGFRTSYRRERGHDFGPQVALSVRQAYFPAPAGAPTGQNAPVLRTATLSGIDSLSLLDDDLKLEYGFAVDSITLYGRMNYFSPFARATYRLGAAGQLRAAFSSGFTPVELLLRQTAGRGDMGQDLTALAQAPRVSRRDNHAAVERTKTYELTYEITDGRRTWTASAFRDDLTDAALFASGATATLGTANLLPDINSRGTVFNAGSYQRTGVTLAWSEWLTDTLELAIAGGRATALVNDSPNTAQAASLGRLHQSPRSWVTIRIHASLPGTRTEVGGSYGWTDFRALMPVHQSITGLPVQQAGWNLSARQPLPGIAGVRMEIQGELCNALAQGYLRATDAEGRTAILTNMPRQVRGGMNFIF
jgi:hypothetical protein